MKSQSRPQFFALVVASLLLTAPSVSAQEPVETVIRGGRVMDPESGTDRVTNIGIVGGRIVALSDSELSGAEVVDARGLVVAPGFIDLHAHGQDHHPNGRCHGLVADFLAQRLAPLVAASLAER